MKYGSSAERRGIIMDRLQLDGVVATAVLARDLAVSEMTVRRDLVVLHDQGAVLLVRGGAALPMDARSSFGLRQGDNAGGKRRIATCAAALIGPGETVALDAGTTAYALAEALGHDFTGCVVTSSVPAVQLLMDRSGPRVIALGGEVHGPSRACTGKLAVDGARQLRVTTFFLGAAAVDARGVYVEADLERPTKLALMAVADRVVLLATSEKFARSAPLVLCSLAELDLVVTDQPLSAEITQVLHRAEVQVRIAGG